MSLPLTATLITEALNDFTSPKCTVSYSGPTPSSHSFDQVCDAIECLENCGFILSYERITSSSRIYFFIQD